MPKVTFNLGHDLGVTVNEINISPLTSATLLPYYKFKLKVLGAYSKIYGIHVHVMVGHILFIQSGN